jgi:hypothetical protein
MVPQTVGFELEVRYDRFERGDKPATATFVFHTLEAMETRFRKERKRRALADRATSGRYRLFLTAHGKAAVAADPDCAARHADVGTWHEMIR